MAYTKRAADVFASTDANGQRRSIVPAEAATWGTEAETFAALGAVGITVWEESLADLPSSVNGTFAAVLDDQSSVANNGIYERIGGAWVRKGPVPGFAAETSEVADESITNPKLAHIDQYEIKGRVTSGTGDVEDLTANNLMTVLEQATTPAEFIPKTPQMFGAVGDGTTDDTTAIIDWLESGGTLYAPEGNYLIDAAGADAGGAYATVTKDVDVTCHPRARFVAGTNLDNDMIRLTVPSNGAGLPTHGLAISWRGGIFDQSGQRNSTVIPDGVGYPGANPGSSATTDALSLRGAYTSSGVKNGFRNVLIEGVEFYAGDHWEVAGGDSGIYIGDGAEIATVRNCVFRGSRDLGVYGSWDETGAVGGFISITQCKFVNCFFGAAVKRSAVGFYIGENEYIGCVTGCNVNVVAGSGTRGAIIGPSVYRGCGQAIRLDTCDGVLVEVGVVLDVGAVDDGGSTVTLYPAEAVRLRGCTRCQVRNGVFLGKAATHSAIDYTIVSVGHDGSSTDSTYNTIENLRSWGGAYRTGANEPSGEGDYNLFIGVRADGGVAVNPIVTGSNTFVIRSGANGAPDFDRVAAADGSASAPGIYRRGNSNHGIFFATNKTALAFSGTELYSFTADKAEFERPVVIQSYATTSVPSASTVGAAGLVYITNETGGPVLAFSDGTNWRRVTDRATIAAA